MTNKQRLMYGARIRMEWFYEAKRQNSVLKACRLLGVPRRTYYYWYNRWLAGGKTLESLFDESRTPHTHANDPDAELINLIVQLRLGMMYGENNIANILLRDYGVKVSVHGVHNILSRAKLLEKRKRKIPRTRKLNDYPYRPGEVMQLDVKHWKTSGFQYDIIDCCTRIKFKYVFEDFSVNTTVKFLVMALKFYEPAFKIETIQTDNGSEFTNNKILPRQTIIPKLALPERWLMTRGIAYRHIPPSSPHLNGRIERPHGVDKWRYEHLTKNSHSLSELKAFATEDCLDYNTYRPHSMLGNKTPLEFLQSLVGYEHATLNFSVLA